jgi:hypothetical protein
MGDMQKFMDPLQADGIVRSRMVGSIRELVRSILVADALLSGLAEIGAVLFKTGGFSNRTFLRRKLGLQADSNRGGQT